MKQRAMKSSLLALFDLALTLVAFWLAWRFKPRAFLGVGSMGAPGPFSLYAWILAIVVPVWPFLLFAFGLYEPLRRQAPEAIFARLVKALALGLVIFGATVFFAQAKDFSRFIAVSFFVLDFAALLGVRLVVRAISEREPPPRTILVVAGNGDGAAVRELRRTCDSAGVTLERVDVGSGDGVGVARALGPNRGASSEVLVAGSIAQAMRLEPALAGTQARLLLEFEEPWLLRAHSEGFHELPTISLTPMPAPSGAALAVKRALDAVGSGALLLVYSPLFLVIAALIRATSRGPVLYRQNRLGIGGRPFTLYKFRSMRVGAHAAQDELRHLSETRGLAFKMRRDPRVTAVGRVLRRFSIDELPQLWNVLRGDMSLVGPRPLARAEIDSDDPIVASRLAMKPGLTCLWQVLGRSEIPFADWAKLDRCYVDNWSLALDLKILLRTIPAVVLARGAI
ncbi:MAG: sugar transferase [Planctomycetes bacterium]|nr:sugar transferase [Planctomycetota bacterium]MBI3846150.1 sugar transferase [Planctomycetota bacterium]